MKKNILRANLKEIISGISNIERKISSAKILENLFKIAEFNKAQVIYTYISRADEPDTIQLIKRLKNQKKIFIPKIEGNNILWQKFSSFKNLKKNKYNILEPFKISNHKRIPADIIIIPGLGFTKNCNRIGRGKGFFDRFLGLQLKRKNKPLFIGLAFEKQILDKIPMNKNDIKLDIVITEKNIYKKN